MHKLIERPNISAHAKTAARYQQLGNLLQALENRQLPVEVSGQIHQEIDSLNANTETGRALERAIKTCQFNIIKLLEKKLKVVPKNYYRNLWLAAGMTVFGLPLGVAFGAAMKNMGLLAIGLPIGMGIGLAVGTSMDKKALQEGRQLDFEAKH